MTITLAAGITLMVLLHHLAWALFDAAPVAAPWMRGGMGLNREMPWFMPIAPLATALVLTCSVLLAASLIQRAKRNR